MMQTHQPKETREPIDSSITEEMSVLRASNLLFEDDIDHIDTIFSNFESNKNESMKTMFRGSVAAAVVAVGLGFYVFIGGIAFVLVSAFYAYRTSDYFWRKHRRLKSLKRLMSVVQSNFSLVNRLIKFIYESENLLKAKFRPSQRAGTFVLSLKSDYVKIQTEINKVLSEATAMLLQSVDLVEYVDNSDAYVCQVMEEFRNCENVSQLYNIYMLLQSQFLTRLIFSLVPNLLTDPKKSEQHIEKIIAKVVVHFEKLEVTLNTKLKFALLNGVSGEKDQSLLSQKERTKKMTNDMILKNVHDLSNSLQYCLLKARELENNLERDEATDPELDLSAIDGELNSCRAHISDILIINQKLKNTSGPVFPHGNESEISDSDGVTLTELGFPDLDPKVDDDIFEAFIDGNESNDDAGQCNWDGDEIDPLAKKKQREMLGELKTRLKPQADDWARRENMVFARKGVAPLDASSTEESRSETPLGEALSGLDLRKIIQQQSRDHEQTFGDSGSEDDINGMDPSVMAEFFLRNLGSRMEEQNFCYSGDESD